MRANGIQAFVGGMAGAGILNNITSQMNRMPHVRMNKGGLFVCLFVFIQAKFSFYQLVFPHVLFWTTGVHSVQRAFPMSIFVAATAETRTPTGAPRSDRACLIALRWNINILDGHTSWSRGYSIAC